MERLLNPLTLFILLSYLGCGGGEKKAKEGERGEDLKRLKSYIIERTGGKEMPADHHFIFVGIGKGCLGCSRLITEEAKENLEGSEEHTVFLLTRRLRKPRALQDFEELDNAHVGSRSALNRAWDELPFPLYLRTGDNGQIQGYSPIKGRLDSILRILEW